MLPFEYRLTKYDPDQRDDRGAFIGDDWISVSDVGSVFDGRRLTLARYLEVEAAHLAVVAAFMTEAEVDGLIVGGLEQRRERPLSVELVKGRKLTALEVTDTLRHLLREDVWCRLEAAERF
ncbi:MAG: hypothetical protein LC749_09030, partial [Actinobacteria bacterium]|nr:hypothetical protein [Actinomycetota bacterium]